MSSLFSVCPFLLALQYHICQTLDIILWVPEALFLLLFFFSSFPPASKGIIFTEFSSSSLTFHCGFGPAVKPIQQTFKFQIHTCQS